MRRTFVVLFLLLTATIAVAQDEAPKNPFPEPSPNKVYVRRVSLGISANFLAMDPFQNESQSLILDGPPHTEYQAKTTPGVNIAGFGGLVQFAITGRFALALEPSLRNVKYTTATDVFVGTDNPATTQDDRKQSHIDETTASRFFDVPVMVRYYLKDRHQEGTRWFFDGGGVWRLARNVTTEKKTSVDDTTTNDNTAAAHRARTTGFTGGVGAQFIDDVGIRVVPEFRYTRWLDRTFDSISAQSRKNQAEFILSVTF
jgi:opacity protein-like surface antigen